MHDSFIAFTPDLRCLHPFRPMGWTILFVEKFCVYAVRIAFHRQWPVAKMRQKHRRDPDVIIDYLPLSEADLWIEDLIQVRNRKLSSFDDKFCFLRHFDQRSTLKA